MGRRSRSTACGVATGWSLGALGILLAQCCYRPRKANSAEPGGSGEWLAQSPFRTHTGGRCTPVHVPDALGSREAPLPGMEG